MGLRIVLQGMTVHDIVQVKALYAKTQVVSRYLWELF